MKILHLLPVTLFAVLLGPVHAADPVVSNLTAGQRAGTKLMETPNNPGNVVSAPNDPSQTPKGLSDSDWSGIRSCSP